MEKLRDAINSTIRSASFKNKRTNVVIDALSLYNRIFGGVRNTEFGEAFNQYRNWELTYDSIKTEIIDQICSIFRDFIEIDKNEQKTIGIGYNLLNSAPQIITISKFTQEIIQASVAIGPDKIIEILDNWKNRVPLPLSLKSKIIGLSVCKTTNLTNLVRILPSSYQSHEHIESQSANLSYQFADNPIRKSLEDLDTLTVDFEIPSGLFLPSNTLDHKKNLENFQAASKRTNQICQTLSLAGNTNVSYSFSWIDTGNSALFFSGPSVIFFAGNSVNSNQPDENRDSKLSTNELQSTTILFLERQEAIRKKKPTKMSNALDISIFRLVESMRISDDLNQLNNICIDMRIALESLFLFNKSKSKNRIWFLVPANCVCLIENNPSDKSESYKTLEDFYDIASQILHSSEGTTKTPFINSVEMKRKELANSSPPFSTEEIEKKLIEQKLQSLHNAQKVLLLAIKKVLEHGSIPNWDKLIFKNSANFSKYRGK